jgi:cytochrome c
MKKILELAQEQIKNIAPAIGLAVVIALFVTITTNVLYRSKASIKRGFEIELSADGKPIVRKAKEVAPLSELMKLADVKRGAKFFKKCASCHTVGRGEATKVGPNLFGIIGKKRAANSGFKYSKAMKAKGGSWNRESVNEFITKPKNYLPGTKMAFSGLRKPQQRADVILFLESQK